MRNRCRILFCIMNLFLLFLFACKHSGKLTSNHPDSDLKWATHQMAAHANLLNLKPGQSVEICADKADWIAAAHSAIEQWSSAMGRWGHFRINPCESKSDLKIVISGFNQIGLNYFAENPGKIYIQADAKDDFLKAIMLHEFGHSYGLCDQYTDAGTAGCLTNSSNRQDNDEVMGATYSSKLQLTPGDITGAIRTSQKMSVPANVEWSVFLLKQDTKNK